MQQVETIVAPATPAGESALALIRVSGPLAASIARAARKGETPPPRHAWHADYRSPSGSLLDDVVYCFFPAPRSYTGEDVLELSCHGNPFIVSKIIADLEFRGCRLAEPGEFTKRAFLHGRIDLTEAEAVMDLIRARSDRALAVAQRQLRGALRERIDSVVSRLLDLCAAIDAHVDFPEEDLPAPDRQAWETALEKMAAELQALAATRRDGDLLRDGVKVTLLGEPNAGKSSLLNRLVGFERAIVSPEPGTTRDFIEERITLGGWHIRLFDTAGWRETVAPVERAGVQRTLERAQEADVVMLVVDAGRPAPRWPAELAGRLAAPGVLTVVNKCDRPERVFALPHPAGTRPLEVSALTGLGLEALRAELERCIHSSTTAVVENEGVVVNARHEGAVRLAVAALERAVDCLRTSAATDLAAVDVRAAIEALGAIVGRIEHDQILDRLFAGFCIGK